MPEVRVSFLGAGDAFSAGGRHQAGYLVQGDGTSFLLDCGATTLASMKRDRIDPSVIDTIFISHLHGDHFAGLPYFFLEYTYEKPRERPLLIAGPPGTEERVWALYRAAYKENAEDQLPYPLKFLEMPPNEPVHVGAVEIQPFRVPHQERDISLGLRIGVGGRKLLYSGDTGWTDVLIKQSEDMDLFICECCFFETRLPIHLDYPRIEENRARFGAKRMILTHIGREVLARSSQIDMEIASDGLIFSV